MGNEKRGSAHGHRVLRRRAGRRRIRSRRPLLAGLAAALATSLAAAPASATPALPSICLGDPLAALVPRDPAPLRMGINPAGEAGALGPAVPAVPDQPEKTLDALEELRPPGGAPFVVRLNRLFWSEGEAGLERFEELVDRYTAHGFPVELQVRYHPNPGQEGDIDAWVGYVREVVGRFGPNPLVIALQVTNEVNFPVSPDSSDGSYAGAKDALVRGVIAAKREARARGYDQLTVGFNWVYRMDPLTEASFWGHLRDHGGPDFLDALDWVGLDVYPGTLFPPVEPPGGEADGIVAALSSLRQCFMPIASIPASVPIHVEENGWPTGPGRLEAYQGFAARTMVKAVHDYAGVYNVTDYRWFDLRDHSSSSPNFQHHYGLLRDDYSPKRAFRVYRRLVSQYGTR
jgi:hypothetical protein